MRPDDMETWFSDHEFPPLSVYSSHGSHPIRRPQVGGMVEGTSPREEKARPGARSFGANIRWAGSLSAGVKVTANNNLRAILFQLSDYLNHRDDYDMLILYEDLVKRYDDLHDLDL